MILFYDSKMETKTQLMEKQEFNLSERILKIMNAPDGCGTLFCNIIDIKKFTKKIDGKSYVKDGEIVVNLTDIIALAGNKLT